MYNQHQQQPPYGAPPPQQPYGGQQQQYNQQPYGAPLQPGGYGASAPAQGGYGGYIQGGFGAPPPQQQPYGAPQQSYGGPQPPYGAPPQTYGAPQQSFGGPQPPYGAPQQSYGIPQQSYAATQQPYGAPPPPSASGPRFLGVPIPPPPPAVPISTLSGYNPQFDAERIRKATKGFGTDERTLIDVLAPLDAFQVDVLSRTYEQMVGKSLKVTLEKELSSWLELTLVLCSLGPLACDIHLLHRACAGAGTHEDLLTELLLSRTNEEIFLLKEGYKRVHGKDLVAVVRGELSMKTERLFNMALSGTRDENPFVNQQLVQQDVEALYRAGPGKVGTDEIAICGILCSRSNEHLAAIAHQFPSRHRVTLSHMIASEFSGHMKDALLYIAEGVEADGTGVTRDAKMLEHAMAGAGTKDERLVYRIVRAHWNRPRFNAIKGQFEALYHHSLKRRVEGETTGKYEKALVGIIEQN
ncbi:hypothetical protein P7C73_g4829, partial [Tremellales sp. Uapishka_1]